MVAALKDLDMDQLGFVLGNTAKVTRWIASMNTQYNPIFGVTNLVRDVGFAMLSLSTTPIAGKQAQVMSYSVPALKGIWDAIRAQRRGEQIKSVWTDRWNDFRMHGGKTGYRDLFRTTEERSDAIRREITVLGDNKILKAGYAIKNWLSDYNEAMENAIRLSSYQVGIENGMSKDQAAAMAKGLTVNFNQKGQISAQAGALYAFFNASAQGSYRMYETLTGPMGRKIIIGGITLGVLQALTLAAAGLGDDEPPEFVQEKNIVLPTGTGDYVTIPMPPGFNFLPNLGRVATQFALGGFKDPGKKFAAIMDSMFELFNPLGGSGMSLQTITPTAIDPLAALAENKDWTGKQIYKEDFSSLAPTPGFTKQKDTATYFGQGLSWALNMMSGGTKYKPGFFSPTPDQIDYLVGQFTGGVGRELAKTQQFVSGMAEGDEVPPYKIPLVSRFYGSIKGNAAESSRFYDNLKAMNQHENEVKGRIKNKEPISGYLADNPEAKLWRMANTVEGSIRKLRERKDLLESRGASKESLKVIDNMIVTKMKQFNETIGRVSG
jgi:hypothetical protein